MKKKKKNFFLNLLFTSHQVYGILLTAACADGDSLYCLPVYRSGAQHDVGGPLRRVPQSCSQGVKKQNHHFASKGPGGGASPETWGPPPWVWVESSSLWV